MKTYIPSKHREWWMRHTTLFYKLQAIGHLPAKETIIPKLPNIKEIRKQVGLD